MISQREFTEINEGRKYKVYKCTGGANTIGIGHNIDAKGLPSDIEKYLRKNGKILDEHIDRLYIIDEGHAAVADTKGATAIFIHTTTQGKRGGRQALGLAITPVP